MVLLFGSDTGSNPFGSGSDDEDVDHGRWGGGRGRGASGYRVIPLQSSSPVRSVGTMEDKRQEGSSRGGTPRIPHGENVQYGLSIVR